MNERFQQQLNKTAKNIDARSRSEKLVVLLVLIAALSMMYLSVAFDPIRADIARAESQISSVNRQIQAQQSAYQLASHISFKDMFCRKDIAWRAIAREQQN